MATYQVVYGSININGVVTRGVIGTTEWTKLPPKSQRALLKIGKVRQINTRSEYVIARGTLAFNSAAITVSDASEVEIIDSCVLSVGDTIPNKYWRTLTKKTQTALINTGKVNEILYEIESVSELNSEPNDTIKADNTLPQYPYSKRYKVKSK